MANITLIGEMGADYGHILRLHTLASALHQLNHSVQLIVSEQGAIDTLRTYHNAHYQIILGPGPVALAQRRLSREPANFTEVLLANGYNNANTLAEKITRWQKLLQMQRPDALIFDFAPTAILAARSMSCYKMQLADPFTAPPLTDPLPSFNLVDAVSNANLRVSEGMALNKINQALSAVGLPTEDAIHKLFKVDKTFLLSIPELDTYQKYRKDEIYLGPMNSPAGQPFAWPHNGKASKVFAYLKPSYAPLEQLLKTLCTLELETQLFIPALPANKTSLHESSNIHTSFKPFALEDQLSACVFTICHGGHGTVVNSILQGTPCLIIPQQQEQLLTAHCCINEQLGLGLGPLVEQEAAMRVPLKLLLSDNTWKHKAAHIKHKYRELLTQSPIETMIKALRQSL